MLTKWFLILVLILVGLTISPVPTFRQTVIGTDGKTGAMLYFSPDSEPIAHEITEINLELQRKINLEDPAISLIIEDSVGGIKEAVPVTIKDGTISGLFIFPIRGMYNLTFTVGSSTSSEKTTFVAKQSILKGLHGASAVRKVPAWARAGLVVSFWALIIVVFNLVGLIRNPRYH